LYLSSPASLGFYLRNLCMRCVAMSDAYDMELDIDLDNYISLTDLHFRPFGESLSAFFTICSEDKRREILRIDQHLDHYYSIGKVIDAQRGQKGAPTYNLRPARLFMQDYRLPLSMPVTGQGLMIGLLTPLHCGQVLRLVQAELREKEDLRQDL